MEKFEKILGRQKTSPETAPIPTLKERLDVLESEIDDFNGHVRSHVLVPEHKPSELNPKPADTSFDIEVEKMHLRKHMQHIDEIIAECDKEEERGQAGSPDDEVRARELKNHLQQTEHYIDQYEQRSNIPS